jgi:hypothetical protein
MAALSLKARLLEPSTASVAMANNGLRQRSNQPAIGIELTHPKNELLRFSGVVFA